MIKKNIFISFLFFIIFMSGAKTSENNIYEKIDVFGEVLEKINKEYVLLTNAPRPSEAVKTFLEKMGLEQNILEHVFTSGEAALNYLKNKMITF